MLCNTLNRQHVHLSSNFVRIFVDVQSTFMTADELLHKFNFFSKFRRDRERWLPFGRSVTLVKLIFFSSRLTLVLAQFFPENFLNKRCELQFFWRKTLISARSYLLIFLILNQTVENFVTYYGYCHSLVAPLCFPMFIQINYEVRLRMKYRWFMPNLLPIW